MVFLQNAGSDFKINRFRMFVSASRFCATHLEVAHMKFVYKVSCLFTKHILASGFVAVDSTEILCTPKRSSSIARHFISSTFFCRSAVCLLISQNVNKKIDRTFEMGIFGPDTNKNQLLMINLCLKIIFRHFFKPICWFGIFSKL